MLSLFIVKTCILLTGIYSDMTCRLAKILIFLFLFIPFFFPKNSFAAVTVQITSYKESISVGETFPITVSVSGLTSGQICRFKVGIAAEGSNTSYNYGRVQNLDDWVSYGSSWGSAPSVVSSSDTLTAQLRAKTTDTTTGQKKLRVRVCIVADASACTSSEDNTAVSSNVSLSVTEGIAPVVEDPPQNTTQPQDPEPPACPSGISLSEFVANPKEGEQEWVEIYNENNEVVNLNDWVVDDKEGESNPTPFDANFSGGGYFVIYPNGNKFNDTGDKVRLLCPDGSLVEEYTYGKATRGYSFAKDPNGVWVETTKTTAFGANTILKPAVAVKEEEKKEMPLTSENEVFAQTQSAGSSAVLGESAEKTETEGDILPEAASDFRPNSPPIWRVKGEVEATNSSKVEEASSEASRSAGKDFSKGLIGGGALLSLGSLFYIVLTKFKQIPKN